MSTTCTKENFTTWSTPERNPTKAPEVTVNPTWGSNQTYEPPPSVSSSSSTLSSSCERNIWKRLGRFWNHGWVAETCACCLAASALLTIIAVLRTYDGRSFPTLPIGITINALVAVLSVILKIGVMFPLSEGLAHLKWRWFAQRPRRLLDLRDFDAASQGPWGSFLFLFRSSSSSPSCHDSDGNIFNDSKDASTRSSGSRLSIPRVGRCLSYPFVWSRSQLLNSFAKISAVLTIVAFAADPFTQQILILHSCQQENPAAVATLARSNDYWTYIDSKGTIQNKETHFIMSQYNMVVAINGGMVSSHTPPAFNCPGHSCTFPDFTTIGACHSCEDVTDSVIFSRHPTGDGGDKSRNWRATLNMTKPRTSLTVSIDVNSPFNATSISMFPEAAGFLHVGVIGQRDLPDYKSWLDMGNETTSSPPPEVTALSCEMIPCIRTMRSRVVEGGSTLSETEIDRRFLGWNVLENYAQNMSVILGTTEPVPGGKKIGEEEGEEKEKCVMSSQPAPGLVKVAPTNVDAVPFITMDIYRWGDDEAVWLPSHCVWSVGWASIAAAFYELNNLFDTRGRFITNRNQGLVGSGSPQAVNFATRVLWEKGFSFDTMDEAMGRLSDAMTAAVRNTGGHGGDSEGEYAKGKVFELATCVKVQWPWISYLVCLVVMAVMWLGVLVFWEEELSSPSRIIIGDGEEGTTTTKKGGGGCWKSSSLALLLAKVAPEKVDVLVKKQKQQQELGKGGATTRSLYDSSRYDLEELAGGVEMQLVEDEEGRAAFV